jgi:carbamoyl-phosphate synthase large subunit
MPSTQNITVFIPSGAGAPGFAGILECLKEDPSIRVIAGDMNYEAYGAALCDKFIQMPASNASDFIDKTIEVCEEEAVQVVLPITTRELFELSKNKSRFQSIGIRVVVSELEGLSVANDKGKLHRFADDLGIPVPEGRYCDTLECLKSCAEDLFSRHDQLFFKPVLGNGSRGIGKITKTAELLENEKAGLVSRTLSEWCLRLPEKPTTPWLLTEYLPGVEFSVDAYITNGNVLVNIPRSRDKMISGISVSGTFVQHQLIIDNTQRLIQKLGLEGPIGVQWRVDRNGVPRLLEINPRLQGTTSVLRQVGVNIPLIAVKQALGLKETISKDVKWGRKFTRHWKDVFLD